MSAANASGGVEGGGCANTLQVVYGYKSIQRFSRIKI